ncbi:MAG: glycosyl hydrolase, partial [Blastocatellia bacterium]|nr:glycosyl hydrolase [Blastocatellia bacterium]
PGAEPNLTTDIGLNRFTWNFRMSNATTLPGLIMWGGSLAGPRVAPGNYQVRLTVDGKVVATESFAIKADPRIRVTQDDFQKQYDFLAKTNEKLSATHGAILEIRDLKKQLDDLSGRMRPEQKDLKDRAGEIGKKLTTIEEELIQTKIRSGQDALNFPIRLNNKLAALASLVDGSDDAPTAQAYDVYNDLTAKIDVQLALFTRLKMEDIAAFNKAYAEKGLPVIVTKQKP